MGLGFERHSTYEEQEIYVESEEHYRDEEAEN